MKSLRPITTIAACAAVALLPSATAFAQRPAPTPEQRLERLERALQQVQRQVFPRGRPADTAGFSDEPAATQSSVATLNQRLDALERQLADILRQSEENGHRLRTMESDAARARGEQDQRIAAIEQRMNEAAAAAAAAQPAEPQPSASRPATERPTPRPSNNRPATPTPSPSEGGPGPTVDVGEESYTAGFKLWEAGQYDEAIASLREFASAHPRHRRVSFANNLIGRALLEKGQARAAIEALLANYRSNPQGERAPDSLYYVGQALMRLGQPGQACQFYAELDAVYGAKVRAELRKQVDEAKARAQCD